MTSHRLPYSDARTFTEMAVDCHEVEHTLHLSARGVESLPSEYLGEPASTRLRTRYDVSDDLAHLAEGMELHFD